MRASIEGAMRTVAELCQRLTRLGAEVSVIGCGTTASQARYPYRTTYGRAKQRQAATYLNLGVPAAVVHLPMLLGTRTRPPARLDRLLWPLFDFPVFTCAVTNAAAAIAALADATGSPELVLQVERANLKKLREIEPGWSSRWVAMAAAPIVAALGHTILRNDPAWQRLASYAFLHLTPPAVRRKADHHMVRPFVRTSGRAEAATSYAGNFRQHPE